MAAEYHNRQLRLTQATSPPPLARHATGSGQQFCIPIGTTSPPLPRLPAHGAAGEPNQRHPPAASLAPPPPLTPLSPAVMPSFDVTCAALAGPRTVSPPRSTRTSDDVGVASPRGRPPPCGREGGGRPVQGLAAKRWRGGCDTGGQSLNQPRVSSRPRLATGGACRHCAQGLAKAENGIVRTTPRAGCVGAAPVGHSMSVLFVEGRDPAARVACCDALTDLSGPWTPTARPSQGAIVEPTVRSEWPSDASRPSPVSWLWHITHRETLRGGQRSWVCLNVIVRLLAFAR